MARRKLPYLLTVELGRDRIILLDRDVIEAVMKEAAEHAKLPDTPWHWYPYRLPSIERAAGDDWYGVSSPGGYAREPEVQPAWATTRWLLREVLGLELPQAIRANRRYGDNDFRSVVATWACFSREESWRGHRDLSILFYGPRLYHDGLLGDYQTIMPYHARSYFRRDLLGQWHLLRPHTAADLPEDRAAVFSYQHGTLSVREAEEPVYDAPV